MQELFQCPWAMKISPPLLRALFKQRTAFSISLQMKPISSRSFDLVGRPDLKTDPRFSDRDIRKKNRAAINREIEQGLTSRNAAEWEVLLTKEGVPAGRVMSVHEVLSHPHLT